MSDSTPDEVPGNASYLGSLQPIPNKFSLRKGGYFGYMGILFIVMALVGFTPSYQAANAGEFKIYWFSHLHGLLMLSWLGLFVIQSFLVSGGSIATHRRLGFSSFYLGIVIFLSMMITSAHGMYVYDVPEDHYLWDVLLMQFYPMLLFGVFFTWAMLQRENGPAHKRLMFSATLVLTQAAIDRMHFLPQQVPPMVYLDLVFLTLFVYDLVTLRRVHRYSWFCLIGFLAIQVPVIFLFGNQAWHHFWYTLMRNFR